MKKFIMIAIFSVIAISMTTLSAAELEKPEEQWTTVTPGYCHNMSAQYKYATTAYQAPYGSAYNQTINCETAEYADQYDGYSGVADMLIEKYNGGANIAKWNNKTFAPGQIRRGDVSGLSTTTGYVSSVWWESINNSASPYITIYASVE